MREKVMKLVSDLMQGDNSGHGMEHINRVVDLAMDFSEKENCNKEIVFLIALLHDVDDYKLFGENNQKNLINANYILNQIKINEVDKEKVLTCIAQIGYSKRLKGLKPTSIEGKIVSDADMCDAIGANGVLRVFQYELKHGKPFFNKEVWPMIEVNGNTYGKNCSDSAVCHMFEKILKLKNLMLTESGKIEAVKRHEFVVEFLKQLFEEEKAFDWLKYINDKIDEDFS